MTSHWQTHKQLNSHSELADRITLADRFSHFWHAITQRTIPSTVEICQVTGQGRPWWYGYGAATAEMTYLESEQDIDMWIEEQLRE